MAKPARYRTIRTVSWGIYLFLALGFIALVVVAVWTGVMREVRAPEVVAAGSADPKVCASELVQVYREVHVRLDAQRAAADEDDAQASAAWAPLRTRLNALGVRCHLQEGTDVLSRAFQKVRALQRLAESAAVQYRHEVGPTDLEARKLLGEAGAPPTP